MAVIVSDSSVIISFKSSVMFVCLVTNKRALLFKKTRVIIILFKMI